MSTEVVPPARDGSIVVCIDGSDDDRGVTGWAVHLAQRVRVGIRLVYALPDIGKWLSPTAWLGGAELESELQRMGQRHLDTAALIVHELDPEIEVELALTGGAAADLIETVSTNSRLLVLGSSRSGPLHDIVFGHSVTELINSAGCPVLVWRASSDESAAQEEPIVVGVDGSPSSLRALAAAFDLAQTLRSELVAVHVGAVDETDELDYGTAVDWQHLRVAERNWLQAIVDRYRNNYPSVEVRVLSVGASVARELRALSATSQVVVVGSRGRGRLSSAILGSVSHSLIHRAECPVLVVP